MAETMAETSGQPIKTEVLIAGGGMVGMATAVALAEAGISCVVVDAQSAGEQVSAVGVLEVRPADRSGEQRVTCEQQVSDLERDPARTVAGRV